eukprot:g173.t1
MPMLSKLFNWLVYPINKDFAHVGEEDQEFLDRGIKRGDWVDAWRSAARRQMGSQGDRYFVWCAYHMPTTGIDSVAEAMYPGSSAGEEKRIPVLVLTAKDGADESCPDIDVDVYRRMFAANNVTHVKAERGRHWFYVQDAEEVNPQIREFLSGGAVPPSVTAADAEAEAAGEAVVAAAAKQPGAEAQV